MMNSARKEPLMNAIEKLQSYVRERYPNLVLSLTPPLHADGIWSLDVGSDATQFVVEWNSESGFGLSAVRPDNLYEGPDEVHFDLVRIIDRIDQMLTSDECPTPPLPVLLARIRQCRGLTQNDIASRLGIRQATVS